MYLLKDISNIKEACCLGRVKDPPDGFVEWALEKGAHWSRDDEKAQRGDNEKKVPEDQQ